VCVKELGCIPLYRFAVVIDLKMALTEVYVRLVLVPPEHKVSIRFDPLNPVKVVCVGLREIKRDL
jgi:hypothetical protein